MKRMNNSVVITGVIALAVGVGIGVVATVARAGSSHAGGMESAATSQLAATDSPGYGTNQTSMDPVREIQDMQAQMDTLVSQLSTNLPDATQLRDLGFNPEYSLSLNMQDLKDRFVVHAFLPDTKDPDVSVKLENNHTLNVNVSNQVKQISDKENLATSFSEWGHYEQVIQLPSPVEMGKMKVVRDPHELIITLPKNLAKS